MHGQRIDPIKRRLGVCVEYELHLETGASCSSHARDLQSNAASATHNHAYYRQWVPIALRKWAPHLCRICISLDPFALFKRCTPPSTWRWVTSGKDRTVVHSPTTKGNRRVSLKAWRSVKSVVAREAWHNTDFFYCQDDIASSKSKSGTCRYRQFRALICDIPTVPWTGW